jgi:hypothetical protein
LTLSGLLLLLLHYHLLSLRTSLCFDLFASLSLLTSLHSSPPVHLLAHRSLLLLGASLRFELFSLLRHLRLPRGSLLGLPYLLLLKRSLGRLTLLFLSLLRRLLLLLLTHLFTLDSSRLLLLRCTRGLLLAFGPPLLFHLLLLLSLLRRPRGLLAFGSSLLFHLLLLLLSLLRRRGCLLLSLGPALLLHLLPRLLLLSLLLPCCWWLLGSALFFAHKLAHFASSRLVTLLGPTCELTHPLRLS